MVKLGTQTGWATDWSDDGNFIIFQIPGDKTGQDLWIAPQSDDKEPYPYLDTEFNEQDGRFSPDGKCIAYSSNESGHSEIYVRPFPDVDGGKWQISTGGGTEPYWNKNGTELFYIASDRTLMSVPVKLDPIFEKKDLPQPIMLIPESAGRNSYAVSENGNQFLVAKRVGEQAMQPITILVNWQSDLKK